MAKIDPFAFAPPDPAIEYGNRSFPQGSYEVETNVNVNSNGFSTHLRHAISGAPFLEELIRDQRARFGCLTSVPQTGYRKLHLSEDENQDIFLSAMQISEPPKFRPLLVCIEEMRHQFSSDDGVAEIWQGQRVHIPKGAQLARRNYFQPEVSLTSLLKIDRDTELDNGSFIVKGSAESGFRFDVFVAEDVYDYLQNPSIRSVRRNIVIHMMSRALEILANEHQEDWDKYPNLQTLRQVLVDKKLQTWDDEDFHPEHVATQLELLEFPSDEADS